jgi:serine acetyltransferase
VVLHRLARWLALNGLRLGARALWQLNLVVTKADLPPTTRLGPGFVATHSVGLIVLGEAGRNVTMHAWAAMGLRGRRNVGAGPGLPKVGEGTVFGVRAAMHGGLRCPDHARLPAHALVVSERQLTSPGAGAKTDAPMENAL